MDNDINRISADKQPSEMTITKPVMEIVACVANCAGLDYIQFVFDLRDNRTGKVYTDFLAYREAGKWVLSYWSADHMISKVPMLEHILLLLKDELREELEPYTELICSELDMWSRNLYLLAAEAAARDAGLSEFARVRREVANLPICSRPRKCEYWPLRP